MMQTLFRLVRNCSKQTATFLWTTVYLLELETVLRSAFAKKNTQCFYWHFRTATSLFQCINDDHQYYQLCHRHASAWGVLFKLVVDGCAVCRKKQDRLNSMTGESNNGQLVHNGHVDVSRDVNDEISDDEQAVRYRVQAQPSASKSGLHGYQLSDCITRLQLSHEVVVVTYSVHHYHHHHYHFRHI